MKFFFVNSAREKSISFKLKMHRFIKETFFDIHREDDVSFRRLFLNVTKLISKFAISVSVIFNQVSSSSK